MNVISGQDFAVKAQLAFSERQWAEAGRAHVMAFQCFSMASKHLTMLRDINSAEAMLHVANYHGQKACGLREVIVIEGGRGALPLEYQTIDLSSCNSDKSIWKFCMPNKSCDIIAPTSSVTEDRALFAAALSPWESIERAMQLLSNPSMNILGSGLSNNNSNFTSPDSNRDRSQRLPISSYPSSAVSNGNSVLCNDIDIVRVGYDSRYYAQTSIDEAGFCVLDKQNLSSNESPDIKIVEASSDRSSIANPQTHVSVAPSRPGNVASNMTSSFLSTILGGGNSSGQRERRIQELEIQVQKLQEDMKDAHQDILRLRQLLRIAEEGRAETDALRSGIVNFRIEMDRLFKINRIYESMKSAVDEHGDMVQVIENDTYGDSNSQQQHSEDRSALLRNASEPSPNDVMRGSLLLSHRGRPNTPSIADSVSSHFTEQQQKIRYLENVIKEKEAEISKYRKRWAAVKQKAEEKKAKIGVQGLDDIKHEDRTANEHAYHTGETFS